MLIFVKDLNNIVLVGRLEGEVRVTEFSCRVVATVVVL